MRLLAGVHQQAMDFDVRRKLLLVVSVGLITALMMLVAQPSSPLSPASTAVPADGTPLVLWQQVQQIVTMTRLMLLNKATQITDAEWCDWRLVPGRDADAVTAPSARPRASAGHRVLRCQAVATPEYTHGHQPAREQRV